MIKFAWRRDQEAFSTERKSQNCEYHFNTVAYLGWAANMCGCRSTMPNLTSSICESDWSQTCLPGRSGHGYCSLRLVIKGRFLSVTAAIGSAVSVEQSNVCNNAISIILIDSVCLLKQNQSCCCFLFFTLITPFRTKNISVEWYLTVVTLMLTFCPFFQKITQFCMGCT